MTLFDPLKDFGSGLPRKQFLSMIRLVRFPNSGNAFQDAHIPLNCAFEKF
jgi:hypothetical protein